MNQQTPCLTLPASKESGGKKAAKKGRQEGIFVGQIRMAQKMLRRALTPEDVLGNLPLKDLQEMAAALEKEVLGE